MANDGFEYGLSVIENTAEARYEHGYGAGTDEVVLTAEHLRALLAGKVVAFNDGEYVTFITLAEDAR